MCVPAAAFFLRVFAAAHPTNYQLAEKCENVGSNVSCVLVHAQQSPE